jgi:alpha-L-fucosidase
MNFNKRILVFTLLVIGLLNYEFVQTISAQSSSKQKENLSDQTTWGYYSKGKGLLFAHINNWPQEKQIQVDKDVKVIKAFMVTDEDKALEIKECDSGDYVLLPENIAPHDSALIKMEVIPMEDWPNLKKYSQANANLSKLSNKEERVVFMGNSITENWVKFHNEFFEENQYIGRGISGQTSAQMLTRFRPDVIDIEASVVVIHAGTNDIAANRGPVTLEQIAGNIFSMTELAKANGIKVVLASVLPANSYAWRPAIYPADKIIALNEMIKTYANKNHILYLDYYSAMVDSNKGLKKEYGRDSVHPNLAGYQVMEPLVKEAIKKALR